MEKTNDVIPPCGCNEKRGDREPLVFVGPGVLLRTERLIAAFEEYKREANDLPEQLLSAYNDVLAELRKPQFKIIECQALIEHVMNLPRLVPADSGLSSKPKAEDVI